MLQGKCVVMGVTGGIAAYKAAEVVSRLHKLGASVDVVMTKNATRFVSPLTFETLSNRPVTVDMFNREAAWEVGHVALAQRADLLLVAPATANVIAKLCHGIADDMLTTTVLATKAPVLLAPAMNTAMWEATATQQNLAVLLARGVQTVGPCFGTLACGDTGAGRMSEPGEIIRSALRLLCSRQDMKGLRVLVTAGPTRERIDPVRILSNDSSGKMGYALAETARNRGAEVLLISGPVTLAPPEGVRLMSVESTAELYEAMIGLCQEQDLIVQAAAPADYRVSSISPQKIKKHAGQNMILEFVENPDVARAIGERKQTGQVLVGFAAETENLLENAREKLRNKHLDMVVANDITQEGAGFGADTNVATLITAAGEKSYPKLSKRALADCIWDEAMTLRCPSADATTHSTYPPT
ncbi:MAG: bifunctional phosphopantothenoylcysteine decarboxylase/phosphopantothenate--cysteine ligase CoaBC [Clostridia bacterium]|nr:bifunctional phosphopantothenoylcysteine decarboxylase/phosphopantothenate--cysteine ligase CoaBC [Clostridia bacterium]